jgi:hypothetical protein
MQSDIIATRAEVDCMFPPQEICAMQDMLCFAALADAITGTMYTDITGAFPDRSFKSMQYLFVAYIYKLNAIIVRAMPSPTNASMVQAFTRWLPSGTERNGQLMFCRSREIHPV